MPKYEPKPMIKVTAEYMGEDVEVDIICPGWAMHKLKGGEPSQDFEDEKWERYVGDEGMRAAMTKRKAKADNAKAKKMAANDKRIASLKKSFDVFDEDGSGSLDADEVLQILTRMTGGAEPLSEADAREFIQEFDRDGDGLIDFNEFIIAMGVVVDAHDADGDGEAEVKYSGKEEAFAKALADNKLR